MTFGGHTPQVEDGAWIAPTATLIGQVSIGAGAVVMFGAVLRADRDAISLGAGSNLQDNVVVHGDPSFPTHIGSGVSVGHSAVVHGATIGDNSLVGMNATVLNGASVGEECLIAAGTVVLEGTVIPPGSLVAGVPGKVRRELSLEEKTAIRDNASTYQELARRYQGLGD